MSNVSYYGQMIMNLVYVVAGGDLAAVDVEPQEVSGQ